MQNLAIAVFGGRGSPTTGQIVHALLERNVRIVAIIVDTKDFGSKNLQIWQSRTAGRIPTIDLQDFQVRGIPIHEVDDHNSESCVNLVRSFGIDLLVNGGTPRILKHGILHAAPLGVLNVHPGVLPQFRGATCVEWSIYLDEPIGNTVHVMTEAIDEGPIVEIERCPVVPGERYIDVRVNMYMRGYALMAHAVQKILNLSLIHI